MGYDYEITYKKGKNNLVANSLSHTFDDHGSLSSISIPIPNWLQSVQQAYEFIQWLASNNYVVQNYSWDGFSLRYEDCLVLP